MLKFGIEVEGFYAPRDEQGRLLAIAPVPHESYIPLDAFAGLVELRSKPSENLFACAGEIIGERARLEQENDCELQLHIHEHRYNAKELAHIRKNRRSPIKDRKDTVFNLYNKTPKLLKGGLAIASFQLNISCVLIPEWEREVKGIKVPHAAQYGLLNIPKIVSALDEHFKEEIKSSNRQLGCYCIKDGYRLEYRSLPNYCFTLENIGEIKDLFGSLES